MANLSAVEISNFKGIQKTTVELQNNVPDGRFITLIGLNESGKTTILEAIALSALADEDTSNLFESVQGKPELNDIIPKRHKSSFTGEIRIDLTISLSEADIKAMVDHLAKKHNLRLAGGQQFSASFQINRSYHYSNSTYQRTNTVWFLNRNVKKINGTKIAPLATYSKSRIEWIDFISFMKSRLPRIVYFPTFLIDFPNRIYLEGDHGIPDQYFRGVIDDALKSLEKRLTIADHVIGRVNLVRKATGVGSLGTALRSSPHGQNIDATIQELTAELNFVIFGAWNDIFKKKVGSKRINVEWHIDEESKEIYIEIYIVDGKYRYYVGERSLGFRWFFSFLLFTQFSTFRNADSKVVYLFDEPASNLHAKAQQRLLESFEKIAHPDHVVVYSTHSHYMINPVWLEKAFIVENIAIAVDDDDMMTEFLPKDTDIKAIRYRQFVNDNPTRTTYFQPALDALDHALDPLSLGGRAIITEGKYDFFALRYLFARLSKSDDFRIYPSSGATTMGSIISILRAWGVPFLLLLDDDGEGRKARDRYRQDFLLLDNEAKTIGDILPVAKGKPLEGIFKTDLSGLAESKGFNSPNGVTKSDYYLLFQSLLNDAGPAPKLNLTLNNVRKLRQSIFEIFTEAAS